MHAGLNQVLAVEDQRLVPCPITTAAQLLHFAREAEVNENPELATQYYLEVTFLYLWFIKLHFVIIDEIINKWNENQFLFITITCKVGLVHW